MKKRMSLAMCVFLICQFSIFSTAAQEKYKIGVITALSGEVAPFGNAARNGMLMSYEALPKEDQDRIELIFEDDQFKPTQAVSAFNKLITQHKINAVVGFGSSSSKAISPIAEQKQLPLLAIASDPEISRGKKFSFNFAVTPEEETKILVPEVKRRGYKKVAIISTQHVGMLSMRDAFKSQAEGHVSIVLDEEYQSTEKDFKTYITKIKSKGSDSILALLLPGQVGLFAKQVKELGLNLPIFGYESFEDEHEVELSSGGLLGAWFATAKEKDPGFLSAYTKKYPGANNYAADNAYDIVTLFAKASKISTKGSDVASFFANLKEFHGVGGVFSATGDNRFSLPAGLKIVAKDGIKPIS